MQLAYQAMKTEMALERLSEAQRETEKSLKELRKVQKKTEEAIRDLKEAQRKSEVWWNKRWGELARKMGTMAEDILIPGFPKIAEAFGVEVTKMAARVRIGPKGRLKEYDAVIWAEKGGEKVVFVAEVKSKLRAEDFSDFREKLEFFEQYAGEWAKGKRIIPVMATFNPELSLATERGVLLVGMSAAYVEALNPEVVG